MVVELALRRQARLGISQHHTLSIERPSPLTQGESITAILPDEIIAEVFSYLAPKDYFSHSSEFEECLLLTLVCKRWRREYEPILYRRIDLGYDGWKRSRRVRQLLQNLQVRPDLRGHAKAIHIQLWRPNQNTCNNIAKIVAYCKTTRSIMLHTDLTHLSLPLLDAMAGLPRLESLSLSGHSSGPSIHMVLDHFDLPCLKSLQLSRYGIGKGTDPSAPWPLNVPATPHDLDRLLSRDRYHTGNVTSLVLSDPTTPARASEQILRWPARLERFSIVSLTHSSFARDYTLESIERLLGIHRQSLKFITIGIVPGIHKGMPDFSSFPLLEELHLSTYELLSETPSNALMNLAAPHLRHLSMSFSIEDQHSESVRCFAMEQVRWLADFAALKVTGYPASRLKTIYIGYNPDDSPVWWSDFDNVTWPWDYLDHAAQILAQHGLALTYSQPTWSKQKWEELVEEGRAAKAKRDAENAVEAEDP